MSDAPWLGIMLGTVRTRHLLTHAHTIVRAYGWRVYFRCIVNVVKHGGRATFLEAIW